MLTVDEGAPFEALLLVDFRYEETLLNVTITSDRVSVRRAYENDDLFARPLSPPLGAGRHKLRLRRTATELVLALDGLTRVRLRLPAPALASVGYAEVRKHCHFESVRLQPLGEVAFTDDFMRTADEAGDWEQATGKWSVAALNLPQFSANPFCFRGSGPESLATAGRDFWADYLATAAVRRTATAQGAGLGFAYLDQDNFYRLDWVDQSGGLFRLVRRHAGHETVLATQRGLLGPDQWYEFEVFAVGNRVLAGIDRNLLFSVWTPELYGGQVALWSHGEGAVYFDDVRVAGVESPLTAPLFASRLPHPKPEITPAAVSDKYMRVWAQHPAETVRGTLLDYTFKHAPVEWLAYTGHWGSTTRWECQPQWTWFGGKGSRSTVAWNKEHFEGDVDFECFLAHMKDFAFYPIFRHPGNMCLTVCGDGENLDSGYSFVFAGGQNRWSRLYRRGQVVAETDQAVMPDNRNALNVPLQYRNWYGVRLKKTGGHLSCLVDGKEVLQWQDPNPLPGGRVALWTYDNTLLVARARIIAEEVKAPGLPSAAMVWRPEPPPPTDTSVRQWSFDRDLSGWRNRDDEQGAQVTWATGVAGRADPCLKATNAKGGGTMAFTAPFTGIDASRSTIRFEYVADPETKVNLYLKVRGWWYTVVLTGIEARNWRAPRAGRFPSGSADGKWHTASLDLGQVFKPQKLVRPVGETGAGPLLVEDAFFGFWSDDPYAMCGLGGNRAGATFCLDNVKLLTNAKRSLAVAPTATSQTAPSSPGSTLRCDAPCNFGGPRGLTVRTTPWARPDGSKAFLFVNERLGGLAGAALCDTPFDTRQHPVVAFDYRVDHTARLDFQVELAFGASEADRWRTVKFTDNDHTWPVIGACEGVVAEGTWQHAEFDLGAMLKAAGCDPVVARLLLASGGWPGNEDGVHFWLANVRLLPAPATATPPAPRHPPRVVETTPGHGERSGQCQVRVALADAGNDLAPASLRLRVGKRTYTLSDRELTFDPQTGVVTWNGLASRPAPTRFRDGAEVACQVAIADLAGSALTKPLAWTWRFDSTLDVSPPPAPVASWIPAKRVLREGFEGEEAPEYGHWQAADVRVTQAAAATGRGALLVTDGGGNRFTAGLQREPVDPNEYPYLSVDLLVDPLPGFSPAYSLFTLQFNGEVGDRFTVGEAPAVVPGKWVHAEFDLRSTMSAANGPPYFFMIGGSGPKSPRPGTRLYLDNLTLYSRASREASTEWSTPPDASGIAGFSWCFDDSPETVPDETSEGPNTTASWTAPGTGTFYFHVRAVDGSGNWGPAGHCQILVE